MLPQATTRKTMTISRQRGVIRDSPNPGDHSLGAWVFLDPQPGHRGKPVGGQQ
jgi:hypothetical protein